MIIIIGNKSLGNTVGNKLWDSIIIYIYIYMVNSQHGEASGFQHESLLHLDFSEW